MVAEHHEEQPAAGARLATLRRKLNALGIGPAETLDPKSLPLAERLTDDLGRGDSLQRALLAQTVKSEALQRENARLLQEHGQLHVRAIREAEAADVRVTEADAAVHRIQAELAEARFWRGEANAKIKELTDTNAQLRQRVAEMERTLSQGPKGFGGEQVKNRESARIALVSQADQCAPRSMQLTLAEVKAADVTRIGQERIAQLESELHACQTQHEEDAKQFTSLQAQLVARDAEIQRVLSLLETGRDMKGLTSEYQAQESERIIASLNEQLDVLTVRLHALEADASEKKRLEAALKIVEAEKADILEQLKHNELDALPSMQPLAQSDENISSDQVSATALSQVVRLQRYRIDLTDCMQSLPRVISVPGRELVQSLQDAEALRKSRTAMEAEVNVLRSQLDEARSQATAVNSKLRAAQQSQESKDEELSKRQEEVKSLHTLLATRAEDLQKANARVNELVEDIQQHCAMVARLQQEGAFKEERIGDLTAAVVSLKEALQERDSANSSVTSCLVHAREDIARLEALLAAVEADRTELMHQGEDNAEAKARAAAAMQSLQEERNRLQRQCNNLEEAIKSARARTEELQEAKSLLDIEHSKMRSALEAANREHVVVVEEVQSKTAQLAEAEAQCRALALEADKKSGLQLKLQSMQEELTTLRQRCETLSSAKGQLNTELVKAVDECGALKIQLQALERQAKTSGNEVDRLTLQTEELEHQLASARTSAMALHSERDSLQASLNRVSAELRQTRSAQQEAALAANAKTTALSKVERRCTFLENRAKELAEQLQDAQNQLQQTQEALRNVAVQEEALRQEKAALLREIQSVQTECEQMREEQASCADIQNKDRANAAAAASELQNCRAKLAEREKEVESLKGLVSKLDKARNDMAEKQRTTAAKLKLMEEKVAEVQKEVTSAREGEQERRNEVAHLRGVVRALDEERDRMQAELDSRAEEALALRRTSQALQLRTEELGSILATAEGRIESLRAQAQQSTAEATSALERVRRHEEIEAALHADLQSKKGELQAVAEDLATMTREQQAKNSELLHVAAERNAAVNDLREVMNNLASCEQLVVAKEKELEGFLGVYHNLEQEHAHVTETLHQCMQQSQDQRAASGNLAETLHYYENHARALEEENTRLAIHLQEYEVRVDTLTRESQAAIAASERQTTECATLRQQLQVAQRASTELDRKLKATQRDLAAAEAGVRMLRSQTAQAQQAQEVEAETSALHQARASELEGLLNSMRMAQLTVSSSSTDAGSAKDGRTEDVVALRAEREMLAAEVVKLQRQLAEGGGSEIASTSQRVAEIEQRYAAAAWKQEAAITQLRDDLQAANKKLAFAQTRAQEAHNQLSAAHAQLEQSIATANALRAEYEAMHRKYKELRTDNKQMLDLMAKLDGDRTALHRENAELNARCEDVKGALDDAMRGGSAREGWAERRCAELLTELERSEQERVAAEKHFEALVEEVEVLKTSSRQ
eukprot:jgi/Chlat1/1146/Chrsp112S01623